MAKSTLKKRSDGRYAARIYLGTENGKKVYKTVYGKTAAEAEAKATELRAKLKKGIDIISYDDTYNQWASRLKAAKEVEMSESEWNTFIYRVKYFADELGTTQIKNITQTHIQPLINRLASRNPKSGKPSSHRTIERYLSAISAVFEYAIENRAADFNPCQYVKIPRNAPVNERRALTDEEIQWIEETPHRAQTAAMLLLYSGLRRGEATALLWSDIDFRNHTIRVNKSYDFKTCTVKSPKTAAGTRLVNVPSKLIDYLKTVKRTSVYVLTKANGGIMTETAWRALWESYLIDLSRKYGKYIEKRNKFDPRGNVLMIEPFTPHCLRHTFCTLMYKAGIDALTAKEQMGHSDIKTTLSIYTHLDQKYKNKNICKLDDYLSKIG